jgi:hypothetical protein
MESYVYYYGTQPQLWNVLFLKWRWYLVEHCPHWQHTYGISMVATGYPKRLGFIF